MAWNMTGTYIVPCSCKVVCPCALGEMEGDNGWCSGAMGMDIRSGTVDGVNIGGTKVVMIADWPSGFLAGNGTGRFYFDTKISKEQRAALEPVLKGDKGGVFEAFKGLVPKWLPSKDADVAINVNKEGVAMSVAGVGKSTQTTIVGEDGAPTILRNAPAAFVPDTILARSTDAKFKDPDLRDWQGGGHAEQGDFTWSG